MTEEIVEQFLQNDINYIEIQLRSAKLNLIDDQNIQIQFAIISEDNEIKKQLMIKNIQDKSTYKLEYQQNDKILQIILIDGDKQIGFSNQTLENLQIQQTNEIKLIHEQIVVGVLSIQFSKPKPEQIQSERLKQYLKETGLEKIFMVIFTEIMIDKVNINDVYKYTAKRLRELGQKIQNEKI